ELVGRDAAPARELPGHHGGAVRHRPAPRVLERDLGIHLGEAAHRGREMSEVDDAAILAVGDALESDALLERHRLTDEAILRRAKRFCRETAFVEIAAGGQQSRGPEKAADVLGPERLHAAGSYRIYFAPCGRAACCRSTSRRRRRRP